ncbi:MAG: hypothetical protein K2M94_03585 [Paramuribaculum sp.]|nr:hypothetical protein [Paramuribaculum sp.]
MITDAVIDSLYKKYKKAPASPDELDIALLFENLLDTHDIMIDDRGNLIINSLPPTSFFRKIALSRIHAIVEFEHKIAIVLHSSILFLNKHDSKSHLHIKPMKRTLIDRIRGVGSSKHKADSEYDNEDED